MQTEDGCASRVRERVAARMWVAATVAAIALCSGLSVPLMGQEPPQRNDDLEVEEVTVTGSRIQQRADYVSPNLVTTIDAADLQNLGIVSISEAIEQIPSNISTFSPATNGGSAFFVGSTIANLRGLNPFFGTRTLTLVNSRRFVPSNQGGSVDLNMIPAALVQRMEVVTGGASAAYGSDAVSGVVNIILNDRLEGVKAEYDYGATTHGDGANRHLAFGAGTKLFGERGHFIFGAEYQKSDAISDCAGAREWCRNGSTALLNWGNGFEAAGTPRGPTDTIIFPGQPQRLVVSGPRLNQANYNGVIFNPDLAGTVATSADESGQGTQSFAMGQFGARGPFQTEIGGDGVPVTEGATLFPLVDRKTAYTLFTYDFTDSLSGYMEGSFGRVEGWTSQEVAAASNYCVRNDNAFLQGAFGDAVRVAGGNGASSFQCNGPGFMADPTQTLIRKDWRLQRDGFAASDTKTARGVLGLKGDLRGTWTWDAYYQFGKTERSQLVHDNLSAKRMQMAIDSVIDNRPGSPTEGQIVCRVMRDGPGFYTAPIPGETTFEAYRALGQSCVPLNPFGLQMSDAAYQYAFGDLTEFNTIKQNVVAASTTGELWEGWGFGPLAAAIGAEHRTEKLTNDVGDDPFVVRTDFSTQFGDAFAGETTVSEVFLELEMPFLRDVAAAELLQLNAAARYTRNKTEDLLNPANPETTVDATTWKLSSVWEPLDWLRVRGSYSRDIRAPGFRELYYSQTIPADPPFTFVGSGGSTNPWIPPTPFGGPQFDPATVLLTGNSALEPEKAKTGTIGFVLTPTVSGLRRMQLAIDYYKIQLLDSIRGGVATQTVTNCFQGDESFCRFIIGVPGGTPGPNSSTSYFDILTITAPYQNGNPYTASGVDFSLDYAVPFNDLLRFGSGNLAFRLAGTRMLKQEVQRLNFPNYVATNLVGQSGQNGFFSDYNSAPKWVGNFSVSYFNGPIALTTQARYTGSGLLNLEDPYTQPGDPGYSPDFADSINDNTVPSAFYVAVTGSYNFRFQGLERTELWANVENLFDREPPYAGGGIGGANPIFFDTLGRTHRVGVRVGF